MSYLLVDVSSAQHPNGEAIDWVAVKASGIAAAFIKATDGTGYTNPFYAQDAAEAQAAGLLVGAYHFAEFTDPSAEALHFLSVADGLAKILDSETSTNAVWQQEFLDALNLPAAEEMDYGSASTLPHGVRALLWPADYGKNPGFGDCWQYADTGQIPGIPTEVDLSTWVGSDADWNAFFGIAPPAPDPPTEEDMPLVQNLDPIEPGEVLPIGLVPTGQGPYVGYKQFVSFSYDAVGEGNDNPLEVNLRVVYAAEGQAPAIEPAEATDFVLTVPKGRIAQLAVPDGITMLSAENLGNDAGGAAVCPLYELYPTPAGS